MANCPDRPRINCLVTLAVGLVSVGWPGCGPARLDVVRTIELEPAVAHLLELPAQSAAQTITVEFSSDQNVHVLLFRAADVPDADAASSVAANRALAAQKGTQGRFAADVPAKTATYLILRDSPKKARVEVKVSNRK